MYSNSEKNGPAAYIGISVYIGKKSALKHGNFLLALFFLPVNGR